jgi:DNA-binding GntR family transcriptional regulator
MVQYRTNDERAPGSCSRPRASPRDYRRLDTLFRLSIAELTGSSLLAAACTDARMRLNDLLNAIPVLQRNIDHAAGQHAAIVAAILAGDAERAGARSPSTSRAPGPCCAASWRYPRDPDETGRPRWAEKAS